MSTLQHITAAEVEGKLNWSKVLDALHLGHQQPRAVISDQLIEHQQNCLLSRAAWVDGLGIGVKSVTAMPNNALNRLPTIQGAMLMFDDKTGQPIALIDSDLVTYWKTAADSVLGAKLLARADSTSLLIVGAGVVAHSLVRAYSEIFPNLSSIQIWNRTAARAQSLASKLSQEGYPTRAADDLQHAASQADIISTATLSTTPLICGDWVSAGTHVDLIGAFRPDMREADDALLTKARIFVDSRATTIEHIGELMIPISTGVISPKEVLADFYDLLAGNAAGRRIDDEITLFKNGGGAHLDVMTAKVIIESAQT